jgi:hypothetical protein
MKNRNQRTTMKKILCLAAGLLALNVTDGYSQPAAPVTGRMPRFAAPAAVDPATGLPVGAVLTKFNLDFPGGKPKQLVAAIEKAMGKPMNVIIPTEHAQVELPPLKMNDVDVQRLFSALEVASVKQVRITNDRFANSYSTYTASYGFKTVGDVNESSVWYFRADQPPQSPEVPADKICQYFSLSEFLNRGFTVDDITTAIQTGWKIAGETTPPELNYHKETKLLMAYGEPGKLETITKVLGALPMEKAIRTQLNYHNQENEIEQLKKEVAELKSLTGKMQQQLLQSAPSPGTPIPPAEKSGK